MVLNSSPKPGRLETQGEPRYQFKSEGKKRPMSQIDQSVRQEEFLLTQPFFSIQIFNWLDEVQHIKDDNL